ncbi:MAG: RidA family protein [Pseudomonadota bacterium]
MAPPKKSPPKKPPAKRRQPRSRPPAPPLMPADQPTMRRRLALLGLKLPEVKPPRFHYVPVVVHGGLAYVSGQVPFVDGEIKPTGKVDQNVSIEEAKGAAQLCALQGLAWLNQNLPGGLDEVERAIKVTGFVASSKDFGRQPEIIDAASEVLTKVFGQAGQHARSAIGLAELPGNAAVEIEFIFALKRRGGSSQQQRRPNIKVIEKR